MVVVVIVWVHLLVRRRNGKMKTNQDSPHFKIKCKYCGKEIFIDSEGDWLHKKPAYNDARVCQNCIDTAVPEEESK